MRLRPMRPADRPRVREVYEARARMSAGLMERRPAYWRRRWQDKSLRGTAIVAEVRGRIVGYAIGSLGGGVTTVREIVWLPESDSTEVGPRLVEELLRRLERICPISVAAFEMAGSPALPLLRAALGKERPSSSVFMAGVIDRRALLKDAVRVLRRRRANGLRLRVGSDAAAVGRGPSTVTVSMGPNVLLGLVFGIRDLPTELRRGTVRVNPRSTRGLEIARAAFPPRKIWIADAW